MHIRMKLLSTACLLAIVVVGSSVIAQDAASESRSPDIIDFADVRSPVDSFQYFLDAVTRSDAEYRETLRDRLNKGEAEKITDSELLEERRKAITISFDFDAFLDASIEDADELTVQQRNFAKQEEMEKWLSETLRAKYAERNIKAVSAAPTAPDWDEGKAFIYLDLRNSVEGGFERHKVFMNLYKPGLIWRWYKSEVVSRPGEVDAEPTSAEDSVGRKRLIAKLDEEIESTLSDISSIDKQIAALQTRRSKAQSDLESLRERRDELQRQENPYATPEAAIRTAYRAHKKGDWATFLASHTKRMREAAGEAARQHFLNSSKKQQLRRSPRIQEKIVDPDNPNRVTLKLEVFKSTEDEYDTDEIEDNKPIEGGELPKRPKEEKEIRIFNFVKEGGVWLIDESIGVK